MVYNKQPIHGYNKQHIHGYNKQTIHGIFSKLYMVYNKLDMYTN